MKGGGRKTHLAQRTQTVDHLFLDGAQGGGGLGGDGRVAGGEVVPADLGQGVREAAVQHVLEPRRPRPRRLCRVPRRQRW